ncbi:MAG: HD domain-containing protein [Betaproteobacteria bacterium]|nr:HD domain-containing protein [Betaproteobacteria bacterium]
MNEKYDEHYIASVTALGDTHEVVTSQAVFTRNGIKLVDTGTRIHSAFREKLVQHKLAPPIDQCLTVANGVTQTALRERAREILDSEPRFQLIRTTLPGIERLLNAFYAAPLAAPLAFKLTVAREQRPEIYEHSVQMTLIALFLAIKSRMTDRDLATVAAAGMLHDIGELHIDPELLRPGRRLEGGEMRHVYAHPMTAYMILQEYPQFHPEISTAVFEHHERLDGSGYPRGLKGEEIGPIGQILMLAEAVTTLFEKSWRTHGASRLSVMLKMNRRKFSRELVDHLVGLLHGGQPQGLDSLGEVSAEAVVAQLDQLAEIFRNWHGAYQACAVDTPKTAEAPLVAFVNQRITGLERTLLETGFHPDELAALTAGIEEDAVALAELQLMARESRWQVSDILHALQRRRDELGTEGGALVDGWVARTEALLQD